MNDYKNTRARINFLLSDCMKRTKMRQLALIIIRNRIKNITITYMSSTQSSQVLKTTPGTELTSPTWVPYPCYYDQSPEM